MYHATFVFDPRGVWRAQIDELPEVWASARTLGKAREYLVDALAPRLTTPARLLWDRVIFQPPTLPPRVEESVAKALAHREMAESVRQAAGEATRKAATDLVTEAQLSMRDAADILGLSHQRVQQLVAAGAPGHPAASDPAEGGERALAEAVSVFLHAGLDKDLGSVATAMVSALAAAAATGAAVGAGAGAGDAGP